MKCPKCQFQNDQGFEFCGKCGQRLKELPEIERAVRKMVSERKHVTVMFSDLSGYTAMTERLDPEEVREIMSVIFDKVIEITKRYDGFIERFIGDALMVVFGVPKAHEDDPIRAIKAATDIHAEVESISPRFEERIGQPLTMHTGINTGLVVTGETDAEKGTPGLTGNAINLASRLEGIAKAGEIIVGTDTYRQALNYFEFETLEPTRVKGRQHLVSMYKVQSAKRESPKTHRLQGLQASLIGRAKEMMILTEAVECLKQGQGSIFLIGGDAGTGKSRLIREFKDILAQNSIEYHEGHAYSYTENMPYYPLIHLLIHVFKIDEEDSAQIIKAKVESGIAFLVGDGNYYTPYIGSLLSLSYPEVDTVSPEYWKEKLRESIQAIFSALFLRGHTVVCFEDLHWADPSFLELLRLMLKATFQNGIFICTYRPPFTLFESEIPIDLKDRYHTIHLKDLSPPDAQSMLKSLLNSESIPEELYEFVRLKTEGNPFYLEEMINFLIESGILLRDSGVWKITQPILESGISPTIHGLIAARLDGLVKEAKHALQEASVIGRAFLFKILESISEVGSNLDRYMAELESLDLIRTQSIKPDLEYIFKHALTHEVVYSGLLKKERRALHKRIGLVIEQLFQDRLPEFYEILAFHFSHAKSFYKAVDYLIKSGEKSLKRYAVEESHKYYLQAYNLLKEKTSKTTEDWELLFDLLNKWSLVYYYRGDFKELTELLRSHESEVGFVKDKEKQGMFYGWLGFILQFRMQLADSFRYLHKALKLGEEADCKSLMGYAFTWLTYACAVMDKYEEGYSYCKRAVSIAKSIESDPYLYFKSIGGRGHVEAFRGEKKHSYEIGNHLLEYGKRNSNIRSQVVGHICMGHSYFAEGNLTEAISCYRKAIDIAEDPFYTHWPRIHLGICCVLNDEIKEGEEALNEVSSYMDEFGCELFGPTIMIFLGIVLIKKGEMSKGLNTIEETYGINKDRNWGYGIAVSEFVLGNVYYQIAYGKKPSPSIIVKNVKFLAKNVPFASKRAESYFNKAIESAKQFGAKGLLGQAYLGLGLLHKSKKRNVQAKNCISEAIRIFEECGAKTYLKQANEALVSL
jgi:class 3 adenylate cyclase/tetratricopeptide (TPR) repeat protein